MRRNAEDVMLASRFSAADYKIAVMQQAREKLANFVLRRFQERYITPTGGLNRHGFTIMAVCCLMIEALESFREGRDETQWGQGARVFGEFLSRHGDFQALIPFAKEFYDNVRCGILHQAETTGGWRIRRDRRPLFDQRTYTIQADRFRDAMSGALSCYCNELSASNWDSDIWENFRKKMDAICTNAGVSW